MSRFSEVVPALERVSPESFKDILTERAGKNTPILAFAEQTVRMLLHYYFVSTYLIMFYS